MILWIDSWYDGPLSGMCEVDGQVYYFEITGGNDAFDDPREYHLYQMGANEFSTEIIQHFDFERMVGTHWCFHLPKDKRILAIEISQEDLMSYWEKWPPEEEAKRKANWREVNTPVKIVSEEELDS